MTTDREPPAASPRDLLAAEPGRFSLDQAVAVAAPGGDPLALRYRTAPRLAHPTSEVVAAPRDKPELTVAGFGLVGAGGTLPRHYTATVAAELRKRSGALHRFVDVLSSRLTGLFVLAAAKHRPARDAVPADRILQAAVGIGTPHLAERSGLPPSELLFFAGHLASRTRSAARLAAMLQEDTGRQVTLREFAGGWLRLPAEERTRLGGGGRGPGSAGQHAILGGGAVLGAETWDPQSRVVIRIGPLDRPGFEALLPGRHQHGRISALSELFAGMETDFVINPVLAAAEIPPFALGGGARLGWSSWLTSPRPRRQDGAEPQFQARCARAGHDGGR